ncbi:MAG: desulfoferrodoxin family protein [Ruminiclostridium sp.]
MEIKFFICRHCGNIVTFAKSKGVPVMCCGQKMEELVPNTTDAATEKHVPVVAVNGAEVTVTVGSVAHPMTEEHLIEWVCLVTEQGWQLKKLAAGAAPEVKFALAEGDKAVAAYAYCNLHGLWKADVK